MRTRAEPLRSRRCPVEPLAPTRPPAERWESGFDWFSALRFATPPDPLTRSQAGDPEYIHASVSLTRAQARREGRLRVWVPTQATCPVCWGRGSVGYATCWECVGAGVVLDERPVTVAFPAGLSHGDVVRVPLDRVGLRDVCLLLRFRIS
jgi:hypothetical protein